MALVTGIITTHMREARIVERALNSILNQTYPDIEIIVVDDSPDTYAEREHVAEMVLHKQTSRTIKYIRHEKCQGACAARNTGLHHANGSIVGFLDDDDEWKPDKVEKLIRLFDDPDVALAYCKEEYLYESEGKIKIPNKKLVSGFIFDDLILANFIGSTSFPLIRKSSLIDIGGFDESMPAVQDFDVWLRIAQKYKIDCISDILNIYHIHEGEQITKNYKRKIIASEKIFQKYELYLNSHIKAKWRRNLAHATFYAMDSQTRKAMAIWWKAVRMQPHRVLRNIQYLLKIIRKR